MVHRGRERDHPVSRQHARKAFEALLPCLPPHRHSLFFYSCAGLSQHSAALSFLSFFLSFSTFPRDSGVLCCHCILVSSSRILCLPPPSIFLPRRWLPYSSTGLLGFSRYSTSHCALITGPPPYYPEEL